MHYVDRREATTNIGHALAELDWHLWGYSPDKSDSMTDYYCPAHWSGIATKDGAVVVVDDSSAHRSEEKITRSAPKLEPCPECSGTAKRTRDEFREVNGVKSEVFNINFGSGKLGKLEKVEGAKVGDDCERCNGTGQVQRFDQEFTGETWPKYQPNPARRLWHVERDGKILKAGIGLKACVGYWRPRDSHRFDPERDECHGARALAAKLDAIAAPRQSAPQSPAISPSGDFSITENADKGGVEIRFSEKPPQEVCEYLKGNRWRFTGFRQSPQDPRWYKKVSPEAHQEALRAVALYSPPSDRLDDPVPGFDGVTVRELGVTP